MVEISSLSDERGKPRQQPFALTATAGNTAFTPDLFPERIQVTKERNLDRQQDYCKNEDVTDNGAKNRDIHINGRLTRSGLDALNDVVETGETYTLVSATWSGEILVKSVEIEGPNGWWPKRNTMLWEYRMDVVSTGEDESGSSEGEDGVLSDGSEDVLPSDRRLFELADNLDDDDTGGGGGGGGGQLTAI